MFTLLRRLRNVIYNNPEELASDPRAQHISGSQKRKAHDACTLFYMPRQLKQEQVETIPASKQAIDSDTSKGSTSSQTSPDK